MSYNDDALISMGERWGFVRRWELVVTDTAANDVLAQPMQRVQVAQAALAILDVGLDAITAFAGLLVAAFALGHRKRGRKTATEGCPIWAKWVSS